MLACTMHSASEPPVGPSSQETLRQMMAVAHSAANSPRSHAGSAVVSHGRAGSIASYLSDGPAPPGPGHVVAVAHAGRVPTVPALHVQQRTPLPSTAGSGNALSWADATTPGVSIAAAAAAALAAAVTPAARFDAFSDSEDGNSSDGSDYGEEEDAVTAAGALDIVRGRQPLTPGSTCGRSVTDPAFPISAAAAVQACLNTAVSPGPSALPWAGVDDRAEMESCPMDDSDGDGAASPLRAVEPLARCSSTAPLHHTPTAGQAAAPGMLPPGSGAVKWVAADVRAPAASSPPAIDLSRVSGTVANVPHTVGCPASSAATGCGETADTATAAKPGGSKLPHPESVLPVQSVVSDAATSAGPAAHAPLLGRPSRIPRPPAGAAPVTSPGDSAADAHRLDQAPGPRTAVRGSPVASDDGSSRVRRSVGEWGAHSEPLSSQPAAAALLQGSQEGGNAGAGETGQEEEVEDYSIAAVFSELAVVAKLEAESSRSPALHAPGAIIGLSQVLLEPSIHPEPDPKPQRVLQADAATADVSLIRGSGSR